MVDPDSGTGEPSLSDEFFAETAVAAFDILGMSEMLRGDTDGLHTMNRAQFVVANLWHPYMYEGGPGGEPVQTFWSRAHFGDSVYLFGLPGLPIERQVALLASACLAPFIAGLDAWLKDPKKGYLSRFAVASGYVRWRRIEWLGESIVITLGTAMSRAHALETAQDWIGGAVDASLTQGEPPFDIEYPVPLKRDVPGIEQACAFNWIPSVAAPADWSDVPKDLIGRLRRAPDACPGAIRTKLAKTLAFVEHALSHLDAG